MEGLQVKTRLDQSREPKWSRVIFLSLFLHLAVFSLLLFFPDPTPNRRMSGPTVYEVNLVDLPAVKPKSAPKAIRSEGDMKKVSSSKKAASAKRISPPVREEKPVVIGKRVVERKKKTPEKPPEPKKPKVSPSKLIDQAVAKVKKNVRTEKKDDHHLDRAISNIKTRVNEAETTGSEGTPMDGIAIRMYQMEVEERIKSNWQYPVALTNAAKRKDLEATVVVKVMQDGTIIKSWFLNRSANAVFDSSVIKAVDRSDPLPPFPEGYNKKQDEMEIRFNLSELAED